MSRSPCVACIHRDKSKNKRRCVECERRIAYVIDMEAEPIYCRHDPIYANSYVLPRTFGRQLGPVESFSQMAMTPYWR